jgi:hypothetical protein
MITERVKRTYYKTAKINMMSFMNRKSLVFLLGIIFFVQNSVFAQNAVLTNIIVTNTRDDLLVYLKVEGSFIEKMKKAILSGVPTTFSFYLSCYRARNFWFDSKIKDIKVTNTIKYNNLKEEFIVKRSWDKSGPLVTKSFEEAQNLMSEIDSLKVVSLKQLEKGRHYQIRAKAELSKVTLPFYLHYVFFFVSLWDFETDLYTVDFIY